MCCFLPAEDVASAQHNLNCYPTGVWVSLGVMVLTLTSSSLLDCHCRLLGVSIASRRTGIGPCVGEGADVGINAGLVFHPSHASFYCQCWPHQCSFSSGFCPALVPPCLSAFDEHQHREAAQSLTDFACGVSIQSAVSWYHVLFL